MSIIITLKQAQQLVAFFNNEDAEVVVSTELVDLPAGLYAWLAEHTEEGSVYLGPTEVSETANSSITPGTITEVPWDVAQAICDTPAVDSAIRTLLDDNTGDNATCMVRAIINAYIPGDSRAVADVVAERCRQIDQEGWGRSHDDAHQPGALAAAASRYSTNAAACLGIEPPCLSFGANWPWDESWFKPTTPRRDLVKAAALIIAEIEREDRQRRPVQGSQA